MKFRIVEKSLTGFLSVELFYDSKGHWIYAGEFTSERAAREAAKGIKALVYPCDLKATEFEL